MAASADGPPIDAALGLGGNLGDRRGFIERALRALDERPGIRITAVSALYETEPWGKIDQPRFLNAAARIATDLAPRALLEAAIAVERSLGRERGERWGPRTIDIDILLYGDARLEEPGLTVPHPRIAERPFVLAPLADIMPEARLAGRPVAKWLDEADRASLAVLEPPGWFLA
ncbi:MAG TPA: 2-amino-4-hydroxy-6-hydroxymethyldihydropteridine diphosphokinase [Afifellaceae bacterium]|nr:2-amino-4-hydroxy-6-hydroxymethyldihydropteridine diphosphokinase [Afifellaceae bacterium]